MNINSCFFQCQSLLPGSFAIGDCQAEYSNKCNTASPDLDNLCACVQDPSKTIDLTDTSTHPTKFCAANSKICKADVSGDLDCRDCSDGECPNFAPRCDGTQKQCFCGTNLPFGGSAPLDLRRASTCSGKDCFIKRGQMSQVKYFIV